MLEHYQKDAHVWDWIKTLSLEQKLKYFFSRKTPLGDEC